MCPLPVRLSAFQSVRHLVKLQRMHEVISLHWRQLVQLHNTANSLQDVYKSVFHSSELLVIQDCRDLVWSLSVCVCVCASLSGSCVFAQPDGGQGEGLSMRAGVGISRADCLRQEAIFCSSRAVMRLCWICRGNYRSGLRGLLLFLCLFVSLPFVHCCYVLGHILRSLRAACPSRCRSSAWPCLCSFTRLDPHFQAALWYQSRKVSARP